MKINIAKRVVCCVLTLSFVVPGLYAYGEQDIKTYSYNEIASGSAVEMTQGSDDVIIQTPMYSDEYVARNLYNGNIRNDGAELFSSADGVLYRNALNEEEKKVYDYSLDRLKTKNIKYDSLTYTTSEGDKIFNGYMIKVNISANTVGYNIDSDAEIWTRVRNIANAIENDNTDIGWIGSTFYGYSYYPDTNKVSDIHITWLTIGNSETAVDNNEQYLSWCDNIAKEAKNYTTDYDRVKYIHDVILDSSTYDDYAAYEAEDYSEDYLYGHSPYGICMKNKAVCEGYAKAFNSICNRADIASVCQVGWTTGVGHEWNLVKMNNNKWYYVDTTWDDSNKDSGGIFYYIYFLNGSTSFDRSHHNEYSYSNKLNLDIDSKDFSSSDASPFETTKATTTNTEPDSETTTAVYDDFLYTLKDGNAVILGYIGDTRGTDDFVIPAYINGIRVAEIGESAFEYVDFNNRNIIISDGIEVLCSHAFWGVTANKIYVPKSVRLLDYTSESYDGSIVHGTDSMWAYVFSYADIREIDVDSDNQNFCSVDGVLYKKDRSALINYPRLKADTVYRLPQETRTIACTAFAEANNLKKVYFSNDNAHFSTYTFAYCELTIYGTETNRAQLEEMIDIANSKSHSVLSFKLISEDSVMYGDVNGDGEVNGIDLLRLAKYFAGWDVVISSDASDVNGDLTVNGLDLLRLAKYFAGWDVQLGE